MTANENSLLELEGQRFNLIARMCRNYIRYGKETCFCSLKKISSLPSAFSIFGDEFTNNQKVNDCLFNQFGLNSPDLGVDAVNSGVGTEAIAVTGGNAVCSDNKIDITFDYVGFDPAGGFNFMTIQLYYGGSWHNWFSVGDGLTGANSYEALATRPAGLIGSIPVRVSDTNSGYVSPTVDIDFGICDSLTIGTAITFCPYNTDGGHPFAEVQVQVYYNLLPPSNDIYIEYFYGGTWHTFYHVGNIGDVTGVTAFAIYPPILCAGQTIALRIKDVDTGFISTTYNKSFNTCI